MGRTTCTGYRPLVATTQPKIFCVQQGGLLNVKTLSSTIQTVYSADTELVNPNPIFTLRVSCVSSFFPPPIMLTLLHPLPAASHALCLRLSLGCRSTWRSSCLPGTLVFPDTAAPRVDVQVGCSVLCGSLPFPLGNELVSSASCRPLFAVGVVVSARGPGHFGVPSLSYLRQSSVWLFVVCPQCLSLASVV